MSRILDFYAVRWEYEPHTFPILWNLDGDVVESFSPDFYLPDLDLYLEMTTLRQKLVRKKNRKLRRLRELYPDLNVKLFYARDFRALMLKYGRLALVDGLSGLVRAGRRAARRRPSWRASRSTSNCPLAIDPPVVAGHAAGVAAPRRPDHGRRKDPRSSHERGGQPPRRRRRDPPDRGGDRGQGPRARRPDQRRLRRPAG